MTHKQAQPNDRSHEEASREILRQLDRSKSCSRVDIGIASRRSPNFGKDIQKVEFGWPIGRPHCAPLGHGLWEVRSDLDSNRIARVIFCLEGGQMILLHGFIKKTQKAPKQDMDLALKRRREVT
jgi:phage-related protein